MNKKILLIGVLMAVTAQVCGENVCIGATQNFSCSATVTESCALNGSMDCSENGLIIGADNITIDGAGYNLTGNGSGNAISPNGQHSNVTIENFNAISNFGNGIFTTSDWVQGITGSVIRNNTVHNTTYGGISIYGYSHDNLIAGNEVYGTGTDGIDISYNDQYNNTLRDNICHHNSHSGIGVYSAWNNTISNNTLYENGWHGVGLWYGSSDNNRISGNTIYNNSGTGIYLAGDADNNTINNNTVCWGSIDINVSGTGNSGGNNTCDTTYSWNDTNDKGITGCTYTCSGLSKDIVPTEIGWSIASTPLSTTAETFLTETNCTLISKYEGGIQTHIKGSSFFNFNVTPGGGYYTYCQTNESKTITGTPIENVTVQLAVGWNLVGVPSGTTNASSLCESIDDCIAVSEGATGNTYVGSTKTNDFHIYENKGYFVYVTQGSTWNW